MLLLVVMTVNKPCIGLVKPVSFRFETNEHATSGQLIVSRPLGLCYLDPLKQALPCALLLLETIAFGYLNGPQCNGLSSSSAKIYSSKWMLKRMTTRLLILMMLFMSGNVHVHPGPVSASVPENVPVLSTPHDFSCRNGLGFLHFNVRSLVPKQDKLSTWFTVAKPDVVALSETWLKPTSADVQVSGFNLFRSDRKGRCGGVALYISNRFQGTVLETVTIPRQFEFLAVQIMVANNPLTIISVYRPPSAVSETLVNLIELISKYTHTEIVLLGDLNWDWNSDKSTCFKQQCDSLNLSQIINSPTRPNSNTLIDIILTNAVHKYVSVGVFANDLSDHCAIACVRSTKMPKSNGLTVIRRCFKHFSEQAFLHDLAQMDWSHVSLIPSVDESFTYFLDLFSLVANKHAPLKKVRIKNRSNPWFSRILGDLIFDRNKQWALARKTNATNDWLLFRVLRNKCSALTKKLKAEYYLNLTSDTSSNHSNFWKAVKLLQQRGITGPPPKLRVGDSVVCDKRAMANVFNDHFKRAGHIFDEENASPSQKGVEEDASSSTVPNAYSDFDFSAITVSDVLLALTSLDPKKSPGPDGLDPYLLKIAASVIAEPLTDILNLSLVSQNIPGKWKQAYVSPLLKAGDPLDVNNYRPISNLSALSKILEAQVSVQVKHFLEAQEILNPMQSGFRVKHSTVTACLNVLDDIKDAWENNLVCTALFIDLTKAFDTVDHSILLSRLSNLGTSQKVTNWFKSYLVGRTQCVKLGDTVSEPVTMEKGVPQGSILGPLLFLVYINNICNLSQHSRYHMYADDTVLYTCAPTLELAVANLSIDFIALQHELHKSKLLLNGKKTKAMLFTPRASPAPLSISSLDGTSIEWVETYKYLGFWLDKHLNFKFHIESLSKKLKFTIGFFYRLKACFARAARQKLVAGLFLSQLDYGDVIYRFACPTTLASLDPLYHAALRFITYLPFRTHHCTLYAAVGWFSLGARRLQHWYTFIYKAILGGILPSYISSKFELNQNGLNLRSNAWIRCVVPAFTSEVGKKCLAFYGPWSWNDLQKSLKLPTFISVRRFKGIIFEKLAHSCNCWDA